MPRIKTLNNDEKHTVSGNVEVFVYHGKNKLAGPFKSHKLAIESASELVGAKHKYRKFNK